MHSCTGRTTSSGMRSRWSASTSKPRLPSTGCRQRYIVSARVIAGLTMWLARQRSSTWWRSSRTSTSTCCQCDATVWSAHLWSSVAIRLAGASKHFDQKSVFSAASGIRIVHRGCCCVHRPCRSVTHSSWQRIDLRTMGVKLGLDAVLSGNPTSICKTKVHTMGTHRRLCMPARVMTLTSSPQVVCTLGPKSRSVEMIEKLLMAGMRVARFNFSHGSHEYHQVCMPAASHTTHPNTQETLNNLRHAMRNTKIMCAVMLDTKVRIAFGCTCGNTRPGSRDPHRVSGERRARTPDHGRGGDHHHRLHHQGQLQAHRHEVCPPCRNDGSSLHVHYTVTSAIPTWPTTCALDRKSWSPMAPSPSRCSPPTLPRAPCSAAASTRPCSGATSYCHVTDCQSCCVSPTT